MARKQERDAGYLLGSFRARALLLIVPLLMVSGITFDPKLYVNGDNVDYILLAQKVWREGNLWASSKYPPLFPLLLVPLQLLFGTGFMAGKVLSVLCYAAAGVGLLWLAERAVSRGAPPVKVGPRSAPPGPSWAAFAIAGAAMLILSVVEFSHYVMSEIPFLLASVIALWLGERATDRVVHIAGSQDPGHEKRGRRIAGAPWLVHTRALLPWAVAAGAAFYIRTVGIAVLAALPLVLLLRRQGRAAVVSAVLCAVVLIPWVLHSALAGGEGESYLQQIRYINPYLPNEGTLNLPALVDRLAQNGRQYFCIDIAHALVPYAACSTYTAEITPPPVLPAWSGVLVGLLLLLGLVRMARRLPVTVAYTAAFLAICLAWPPIWASVRFVLPILPLCFLLVALGLRDAWLNAAARRPGLRRPGALVLPALLVIIVVLAGQRLAAYAGEVRHYPPRWEAYFNALGWAHENLSPREIVLDRKSNIFRYVTGLEAVSFPREPDDARMLDHLRQRGVTVVHVSSIPYEDVLKILHPFIRRQSKYFEPIWFEEVPGGGFGAFLRFHPSGYQEAPVDSSGQAGP